jgi:2-iminobutanoate/2-iminopropanoate deaminase
MGFFLQARLLRAPLFATVYNESMKEELTLPARTIVATNEAPKAIGPYSQAVRAGNLLFTSGQIALHPETQQVVDGGIAEQAERVFANLKAILEAGGSSFANVVKATVFLKDFNDFAAMNAIYAEHLAAEGNQPPARTTVEVSRLPKDVLLEIDLVAIIPGE